MVMPATVLLAAVSLAATWGWWKFAAVLLIGFHTLLRPSEVLFATHSHLILPGDLLSALMIAYVRVDVPKTDRVYPKQHGKISEVLVVEFLSAMYDDYPPHKFLCGGSAAQFRNRWNAVFSSLGLPVMEADSGVTPSALRGSGATWLHHVTEDIARIQWRGRWKRIHTLESYLQETAAQILLSSVSKAHRARISELASYTEALLNSFILSRNSRST